MVGNWHLELAHFDLKRTSTRKVELEGTYWVADVEPRAWTSGLALHRHTGQGDDRCNNIHHPIDTPLELLVG